MLRHPFPLVSVIAALGILLLAAPTSAQRIKMPQKLSEPGGTRCSC